MTNVATIANTLTNLETWQQQVIAHAEAATTHRMGYHWIPAGNRSADHDYMRRLKARAGKIVSLNRDRIGEALSYLHPAGTLFLRDHPQSEQQADFAANPMETGRRHAREWIEKLTGGGSLAGLPLNRIAVCLLNEPTVHNAAEEERLVAYTREALLTLQPHGIRAMVYNLSSGWVRNADTATVKNTKPIWDVLRVLEPLINQTGSWMGLHEYFRNDPDEGWYTAPNGERWGWNSFRHWACPMSVKIIIGECGMSKRINGNPAPGQPVGWVGNVSPATYAEMLWRYERQCHPNVEAIMPFTTNFEADWQDKDTLGAHADILARVRPHTFPVPWPVPVTPLPPPVEPTDPKLVIFPRFSGRITGFYGQLYQGDGGVFYPHEGMDISMPVGTPIYAAADGVVAWADFRGAEQSEYGIYCRILHPHLAKPICLFYAHLSECRVRKDGKVKQGDLLGLSGNTGNSGGPHLHFEVRVMAPNGAYQVYKPLPATLQTLYRRNGRVDPLGWLDGWLAMGGKVEER